MLSESMAIGMEVIYSNDRWVYENIKPFKRGHCSPILTAKIFFKKMWGGGECRATEIPIPCCLESKLL